MTSTCSKSFPLRRFAHAFLDWVMVDRLTHSGMVRAMVMKFAAFQDSALAGVEGHDSIQPTPRGRARYTPGASPKASVFRVSIARDSEMRA